MAEWLNDWMAEWLNDWMTEWLNEWLSDSMNEWMNERTNERMNEWMSEWVIHKLRNGDQLVGRLICRDFWASQKVLFELFWAKSDSC